MRDRRAFTTFFCALATTMVALSAQSAEPKYQGRSLSKWLSAFRKAKDDSAEEKHASEAVRAIGTNAVPQLLRMLTNADLQVQLDAKNGFTILGPVAAPAVPALATIMAGTNELNVFIAAQALGEIGPPALSALMETMSNRHFKLATEAYLAIGGLGTNARPVIPILLNDLQNPNHFYRERAADALGSLHIEPETVVPALTNLLTDTSPAARWIAINSLGRFGPAARSAVPVITPFLTTPNFEETAKIALREIAPEALTNAPPK
jgi:HEAT repeat protein